jgi:hypothetical protein
MGASPEQFVTGEDDEALQQGTSVYPNPTEDRFYVAFGMEVRGEIRYSITNTLGQEVRTFRSRGERAVRLDLTGLPTGVYQLEISTLNGKAVKRIVKQ